MRGLELLHALGALDGDTKCVCIVCVTVCMCVVCVDGLGRRQFQGAATCPGGAGRRCKVSDITITAQRVRTASHVQGVPPPHLTFSLCRRRTSQHMLSHTHRLTRTVGAPLASLPLDPQLGSCLLAAAGRFNCADHMLLLCGLLSVPAVWGHAGGGERRARDAAVAKFAVAEGDFVTFLNAHRGWAENGRSHKWWVCACVCCVCVLCLCVCVCGAALVE